MSNGQTECGGWNTNDERYQKINNKTLLNEIEENELMPSQIENLPNQNTSYFAVSVIIVVFALFA